MPQRLIFIPTLIAMAVLPSCRPGLTPAPASPAPSISYATATGTTPEGPPPTPTSKPTPVSCPQLSESDRLALETARAQVIQLRGLQPLQPITTRMLTPSELRERIEQAMTDIYSPERAADEARALSLLGLLDADTDLWSLYRDVFTEQTVAFYDANANAIALICRGEFDAILLSAYSHEFAHALQRSALGAESSDLFPAAGCALDTDRCYASQAMLEGDATLLQEQWLRLFGLSDEVGSLSEALSKPESPVFNAAPPYIRDALLFPYLYGLRFVRAQYLKGDWQAVDRMYESPPTSTEQILHPERYPADAPVALQPPALLDAFDHDWRLIGPDVLGEWRTLKFLEAALPEDDAAQAAAGWDGDLFFVLRNEDTGEDALVLVTQWDSMRDTLEFAEAMRRYGEALFGEAVQSDTYSSLWIGEEQAAALDRRANQTRWILAPDQAVLEMLRSVFALPLKAAP